MSPWLTTKVVDPESSVNKLCSLTFEVDFPLRNDFAFWENTQIMIIILFCFIWFFCFCFLLGSTTKLAA